MHGGDPGGREPRSLGTASKNEARSVSPHFLCHLNRSGWWFHSKIWGAAMWKLQGCPFTRERGQRSEIKPKRCRLVARGAQSPQMQQQQLRFACSGTHPPAPQDTPHGQVAIRAPVPADTPPLARGKRT